MSGNEGESLDIRLQDMKEKLSEVHISVIEINQALQGRDFDAVGAKIDRFVKMALDTQRDYRLIMERRAEEGEEDERPDAVAEDEGTRNSQSMSVHAGTQPRRKNSVVSSMGQLGSVLDLSDDDDEVYVPLTSAQALVESDKAAILQAIKDLETTEDTQAPETDESRGGEGGEVAPAEKKEKTREKKEESATTTQAGGEAQGQESGNPTFLNALMGLKRRSSSLSSGEITATAARERSEKTPPQDLTSPWDSVSSGPIKPTTSSGMKDVLEMAALSMAKTECSKFKIKAEDVDDMIDESEEYSDSEQRAANMEPFGGPMAFKFKAGYVQSWLSTEEHSLEELLVRRRNSGAQQRCE